MSKNESFVSVVFVTENDANLVPRLLRELQMYLADCFVDYEIVIVDQCSSDGTQTAISTLLSEIPSIRFIELAYPVAHDVAVAAALENAIGDFVVIFSPRNDPVNCIQDMVAQCREGSDIVVGVAQQRMSLIYQLVRPFTQRLLHSIGYDVPSNATHLRCLSRRAVNAVTRAGRFHHQFFVRIQKTGYPFSVYKYRQIADGERKTLFRGIWDVSRLLVFNSTRPLRWMSLLGVGGSMVAFVVAVYCLIASTFISGIAIGWALFLLFISLMFIVIFTMLAFFGEYMGRLLDDRGEQYMYSVVYEKNSSVMMDEDRANVLNDSSPKSRPRRKNLREGQIGK